MIANIGPADYNIDETVTTLRYASRAKKIQNKPRINEDPKDTMIREFHEEIMRLKAELEQCSGGKLNMGGNVTTNEDGTQIVEVEKVVHVGNKEKMKEMEKALEKEKQNVKKEFERERQRIKMIEDVADEQKKKLLEELQQKEDDQTKAQSK